MKKLLLIFALLLPVLAHAQATAGFHRVSQVIARSPQGSVTAQVVPYATIVLTNTATAGLATVYSDPGLSVVIPNSTLTADSNGNYDYYFPLSYCVTETIQTQDGGTTTVPNVCSNGGSGGCPNIPCQIYQGGTGATTQLGAFTNLVAPGGTMTAPFVFSGGPSGIPAISTLSSLGGASLVATGGQTFSGPIGGPEIGQVIYAGTTQYPTVASAYAAAVSLGIGIVDIPCGTYPEAIIVNTSSITFRGHGIQCTTLVPSGNTPVFTFAAGTTGQGINYDTVENLSIANNTSSTGDGIQFTGGANIPNDRHLFRRIAVIGFRYNVNVLGRLIWTAFDDSYFQNATSSDFYAANASVNNFIDFINDQFSGAQQYGVYWNNTNISGTSQGISFDHVNAEYNGASGVLNNCAGISLTGIGSGQISDGSYFEGNCTTNTDNTGADIRLTGTYAQAFDIRDSLIWSLTNFGILNDATQTAGTYEGNNLPSASTNRIKIATTHALSQITIGTNFLDGGSNLYVPDFNGATHVTSTYPLGTDETVISAVTSNTINAALSSHIYLECGGCSVATITGGVAGQLLIITAGSGSPVLTYGTASNGVALADGVNRTIATGFSVLLTYDANAGYWKEVATQLTDLNVGNFQASGTITGFTVNGTNGFQYNTAAPSNHTLCGNGSVYIDSATNCQTTAISASLVTTSATSDNVTLTGMTSSGHCSLAATNSSAATNIATTYISAKTTNQITVTHTATSGMDLDFVCTPY